MIRTTATKANFSRLGEYVAEAKVILLLQPDKPDGDSLGSMLALEEILGDLGKTVVMYCAGRIESYLHHLKGYDRVTEDWPAKFDLAILVDTAAPSQVARLLGAHHPALYTRPFVVIDHHGERTSIEGTDLELIAPHAAATSELIYEVGKKLSWPMNPQACAMMVAALFADTLNLTTPSVGAKTVAVFAALVKHGEVNVSELHKAYREASATDADLLPVKGQLLQSLELFAGGRIAVIVVPQPIVKAYRERTSLSSLVMYEVLWARGVEVVGVMSDYGTVIRTSLRAKVPVAGEVATQLGGGGHAMAAAFSSDTVPLEELKATMVTKLQSALDGHKQAILAG